MQLRLNELSNWLGIPLVSSSAFTQERANLKHTAFIALNKLKTFSIEMGNINAMKGFAY